MILHISASALRNVSLQEDVRLRQMPESLVLPGCSSAQLRCIATIHNAHNRMGVSSLKQDKISANLFTVSKDS